MALVQMKTCTDKQKNLQTAESMIRQAADKGANVIMLPEIFTCPY